MSADVLRLLSEARLRKLRAEPRELSTASSHLLVNGGRQRVSAQNLLLIADCRQLETATLTVHLWQVAGEDLAFDNLLDWASSA